MERSETEHPAFVWRRVRVGGIVQGVGFRPTAYRLAKKHGLIGEVRNTAHGVELYVGGRNGAVDSFLSELPRMIPAPGRVDRLDAEAAPPLPGCNRFAIAPSVADRTIDVVIPPDQATCRDCLRELFDPADRRRGYALITCTVCGPRYSIIESLPYDRERTTMRHFPLCEACRAEYENPDDRRFHAESIACAVCGPNLQLISRDGPIATDNPIGTTIELLAQGRILAIKGIGGYHLACDAANAEAIAELRRRKGRPHKPFAILMKDLETARRFCEVSEIEARELQSPEAPIVLLRRHRPRVAQVGNLSRPDLPAAALLPMSQALPDLLAPDNNRLGIMLAYTPIQHLLARRFDALVMTSGNVTDEPIRHTEQGARELIGPVADFALIHPRGIENPSDDSIVVVQSGEPVLVRRSRGHVPNPVPFDVDLPPILAVGADLKNACAFGRRRHVYFSPHIGDLEYPAAFRRHLEEIDRFRRWFGRAPVAVACDLHPGYLSTQNAHALAAHWGARIVEVQHHHAHVAACLAEHGRADPVIGVAFDGAGYGADGAIWGGEFLVASRAQFRRHGRLVYHSLPGGERAVHEPWRMLAADLIELFGERAARILLGRYVDPALPIDRIVQMLQGPIAQPQTSSMGRLFDAVGVFLGFPMVISFEAQNAIALESLCGRGPLPPPYLVELRTAAEPGPDDDRYLFEIELGGIFEDMVEDLEAGVPRERMAERFHASVVEMIVLGCRRIREQTGLTAVAMAGGCFLNTVLVENAVRRLADDRFEVLVRRKVPPNDGGVAFGQLAVAATKV
jgi:hydrogenase maturation protein HypF